MDGWRLASFIGAEGPRAGIVLGERIFDLAEVTGEPRHSTMIGFLADWPGGRDRLERALAGGLRSEGRPLAATRLLAPVPAPPAIYCAGANYADHVAEMNAR